MTTRQLHLRRADACAGCATELPVGTHAVWDSVARIVFCLPCGATPAPEDDEAEIETVPPTPAVTGSAGASAHREYERRSARERARKQARIDDDAAWRARIKAEKPVLGRVAAALTAKPEMTPDSQATMAWKTGAAGEERVAEVLRDAGAVALHDRRVPRSRANIDHIAIGPAGIYVIDAKKYTGRIEKRDVGGFFRLDERLYVRGRDRTKLVDALRGQCDVVRRTLGDLGDTPVHGVLCFVGAEWSGLWPKPIRLGSVTCTWPLRLPKLVAAPGPLSSGEIALLAARLGDALPPA